MDLKTQILQKNNQKLTISDLSFIAHFDIIVVRILQKFYGKSIDPVNGEMNSYDVQRLRKLLAKDGLKISVEGLRKKLDMLVRLGFLEKIRTYPRIYTPVRDIENIRNIQLKINKIRKILL